MRGNWIWFATTFFTSGHGAVQIDCWSAISDATKTDLDCARICSIGLCDTVATSRTSAQSCLTVAGADGCYFKFREEAITPVTACIDTLSTALAVEVPASVLHEGLVWSDSAIPVQLLVPSTTLPSTSTVTGGGAPYRNPSVAVQCGLTTYDLDGATNTLTVTADTSNTLIDLSALPVPDDAHPHMVFKTPDFATATSVAGIGLRTYLYTTNQYISPHGIVGAENLPGEGFWSSGGGIAVIVVLAVLGGFTLLLAAFFVGRQRVLNAYK